MQASLVVLVIAKHLNNAALELEKMEQETGFAQASEKAVAEGIKNAVETLGNIAVGNKGTENESSKEASSKESCQEASSQEASKEVKVKKTSTKKATKVEEVSKEVVNVPERKLSLDVIRSECKKVIDEKGRPALAELLASFNATKTSELKEEQFTAVFEACQKILGAGNEF